MSGQAQKKPENRNAMSFSTVIASSVHDMKNSLSMLLNTLDEVNLTCNGNEFAVEKFNQLQYEGQRLNNHLIQLLAIYRLDQSHWSINVQENDVEEFLEESVLQYEALLKPKGIEISCSCESGTTGYFDRELVAGVVNNIINNAYRYSKDKIHLSCSRDGDYLVISIKDNGGGYPSFMLVDNSQGLGAIDFSSGSTGLGLYFSHLVASSHQAQGKCGFIKCSNDGIDGGGKFSIYLP